VRLKCFIIVDLKTRKLTHADLGQMKLYVNYYDREVASAGDNPTLGLILCTDKNDAVVRYVLDKDQNTIFASRYRMALPSEAELAAAVRHEMRALAMGEELSAEAPPAPAGKQNASYSRAPRKKKKEGRR
jgi:hypothetical protein